MSTVTNLPPEATTPTGRDIGGAAVQNSNQPDCERPALARMREAWELPDLLLGGTKAMQDAGTKVLIQEQDETADEFDRRKKRTVLTNYYGNTLDTHSGMPFAAQITFDPPLPPRMSYLERDADGSGRSITVFARDLLRDSMHRGVSHVLVDVPRGESQSFSDTMMRQPRLIHVEASALLGVDDRPSASGEDVVTYARIAQTTVEAVGRYGRRTRDVILEIAIAAATAESAAIGTTVEWTKSDNGTWTEGTQSKYTRASIPLFTLYANQTGDYEGRPAYGYLAELNLAHYQSDADQRHALSYGRRATLIQTGWKVHTNPAEKAAQEAAGNGGGTVRDAMGYGRKIRNPNPDAKAYLLETNGAPLSAGRDDLADLEQRMERFGAQQVSKGGGITATSRQLDNARDTCNLEAWCTRLEGVLLNAVRAVAEWIKTPLPVGQRVIVDRSFADSGPKAQDFPFVQQMGRDGFLAPIDVLREAKARGILSTVNDPEEAANRAREWKQADVVAAMEAEIFRQRQQEPEPGVDQDADVPAPAPADEVTLNEITLGIERLARIGDAKMLQALREQLAEKIGVGSPGKFTAPKPKAMPAVAAP